MYVGFEIYALAIGYSLIYRCNTTQYGIESVADWKPSSLQFNPVWKRFLYFIYPTETSAANLLYMWILADNTSTNEVEATGS